MLSNQGEALTAAKIMIKDLLPLHRTLTYKDQEDFELCKAQATAGRYGECVDSYNTIKERQTMADGNSESDVELDAVLGSDEDPDQYESEGINDGDPDMDREEGQSTEDEFDSNDSEVDAMWSTNTTHPSTWTDRAGTEWRGTILCLC